MSSFCKPVEHPEQFREKVAMKLGSYFDAPTHGVNLEKGIYNYTVKEAVQRKIVKKWDNKHFVLLYLNHLKSIMRNLRPDIIAEVNNGHILPHTLAFMTHQELDHDRWALLIDQKAKRDKNKFEVNIAAATDTFTCRKCKGNQCTYYQMQTRSADEPMTTFCQCILCGNRWKC